MALVKTGTFGSSPQAYYELYAEQLSGSSTSRTIKLTLAIKVSGSSSSRYGYPLNWLPLVHYSNAGWKKLKGNETWYGSDGLRWFDAQLTVDVGTTSATSIGVGFQLDMTQGSSSWETTQTASFGVGSTNTPPKMNGSVAIRKDNSDGEILSGIIPENISTIYLSWQQGSDNEQGSSGLKYGVNEIVNGGGATTILYPTTGLSHTVNIGSGNEGQRRKYYVDCRDNSDALSDNRADSVELTKNSFTGDALASNSTIGFLTESIDFTMSGAKNTNGNTVFTRTLTCDGITVYNNSGTATTWNIIIYRSGAIPDKAYIKFDDIKNKFKDSNYTGALGFTVRTTNAYGTTKTSSKSISVDLKTDPSPATKQEISKKATESTMYKKVGFSNNYYFLPDNSSVVRVQWVDGVGKLGEAVSYEIFVIYGSDSPIKIADISATGGPNYYDHIIPKQTTSKQFKYLIRCKTSYGYHSDVETSAETLHYYNAPSISVGEIERTETTAIIPLVVSTSSSIPDIETVGTWSGKGEGKLTSSQKEQKITVTGLTGNETYTILITYNNNTGFSSNQTKNVSIGANLPIMFLNKYGLGLGGVKANESSCLNVNGNIIVNGLTKTNGLLVNGYEAYTTNKPPTANEVGARPNTWMPTAEDVGAISNLSLNNSPIYDLEFDGTTFKFMDSKTPGKPSNVITGCLLQQTYDNVNWKSQILHDWRNNDIYIRAKSGGKWLPWEKLQKTSATRMLNEDYIETIINENKELKKRNINLELRLRKVEEKLGIGCSS